MIVMGVDPGLNFTGWVVVLVKEDRSFFLLDSGMVSSVKCKNYNEKLYKIYDSLVSISNSYSIEEASIEKVFVNSNPKSSMFLCYARCASIISMMSKNIKIYEYSPTTIKKCITGSGRATKDQVSFMVKKTFGIGETKINNNITDALSVAMCHLYLRTSRYSG